MKLSDIRIGKFTSSDIYLLMKKGKGNSPSVASESYIEDKIIENKLGRCLNADVSSRSTLWGTVLEQRVASLLDQFEYDYCSNTTLVHPTIQSWAGTPDFVTLDRVVDAKCPYTLKAFCQLAEICIGKDYQDLRLHKPDYYWQLVSNSILTGKKKAELIVYCPFKEELEAVRELVDNFEEDQHKLFWIFQADDEDLPYVPKDSYYTNMYKLIFDVPAEDQEALIEVVIKASNRLEVI